MKTKPVIYLFVIAAICLAIVSAGPLSAAEPGTIRNEMEPNNTLAQANPIAIGDNINSMISTTSDIDLFRFNATAGRVFYIAAISWCGDYLNSQIDILDSSGSVLEHSSETEIEAWTAPSTGVYYLRVMSEEDYWNPTGPYKAVLLAADLDQSSYDAPETIAYGAELDRLYDIPNEYDYYRFNGRAGDVVTVAVTYSPDAYGWLWFTGVPGGKQPRTFRVYDDYGGNTDMAVLTQDGQYEIGVQPDNYCDPEIKANPYHLSLQRGSLYVSGASNGVASGMAFGPNDILAKKPDGKWGIVFDGEDVGFKTAIAAFEFRSDGSILLTPATETVLAPIGRVKPNDVVTFTPSKLGTATTGTFAFHMKGINNGLTGVAEKIDAIALTTDGSLVLSTSGSFTVPKLGGGTLSGRDEDLIRRHPGQAWSMYFDGRYWDDDFTSFSTEDLRAVTLLHNEYYDEFSLTANHYLFTFLDGYNWRQYGDSYAVAGGDMLGMTTRGGCSFCPEQSLFPAGTRVELGFPRPFSGLSIGPAWAP